MRHHCTCYLSLLLLIFTCFSCQTPKEPVWRTKTLFEIDGKIQNVVYGPLGFEHAPCLGLAVEDGRCVVLKRQESDWQDCLLHLVPGGLSAVAFGEVDPETPGAEMVLGGTNGQVFRLAWLEGGDVSLQLIYVAEAAVGDILVHDFHPGLPGEEILLLSEDGKATVLSPPEEKPFRFFKGQVILKDTGRLRNGVAGPYGPQGEPGVIFVGSSGRVIRVHCIAGTWRIAELYKNPVPLARVAVAVLDPVSESQDILLVDDAGLITLLKWRNNTFIAEAIHKETDALRGVVAGDLDPSQPGEEFAVFGYGKELALYTWRESRFERRVLFEDSDRGHWLLAAPVLGRGDALEMVTVGYSGKVNLIYMD